MIRMIALSIAASIATAGVATAAPRHHTSKTQVAEQPKERLGTLSCEVAGGIGLVIGSNRTVDCTFKQRTGKSERYTGNIGRVGLDIGVTGKRYMSWIVVNTAPTRVGDGVLAGTYVGASQVRRLALVSAPTP